MTIGTMESRRGFLRRGQGLWIVGRTDSGGRGNDVEDCPSFLSSRLSYFLSLDRAPTGPLPPRPGSVLLETFALLDPLKGEFCKFTG